MLWRKLSVQKPETLPSAFTQSLPSKRNHSPKLNPANSNLLSVAPGKTALKKHKSSVESASDTLSVILEQVQGKSRNNKREASGHGTNRQAEQLQKIVIKITDSQSEKDEPDHLSQEIEVQLRSSIQKNRAGNRSGTLKLGSDDSGSVKSSKKSVRFVDQVNLLKNQSVVASIVAPSEEIDMKEPEMQRQFSLGNLKKNQLRNKNRKIVELTLSDLQSCLYQQQASQNNQMQDEDMKSPLLIDSHIINSNCDAEHVEDFIKQMFEAGVDIEEVKETRQHISGEGEQMLSEVVINQDISYKNAEAGSAVGISGYASGDDKMPMQDNQGHKGKQLEDIAKMVKILKNFHHDMQHQAGCMLEEILQYLFFMKKCLSSIVSNQSKNKEQEVIARLKQSVQLLEWEIGRQKSIITVQKQQIMSLKTQNEDLTETNFDMNQKLVQLDLEINQKLSQYVERQTQLLIDNKKLQIKIEDLIRKTEVNQKPQIRILENQNQKITFQILRSNLYEKQLQMARRDRELKAIADKNRQDRIEIETMRKLLMQEEQKIRIVQAQLQQKITHNKIMQQELERAYENIKQCKQINRIAQNRLKQQRFLLEKQKRQLQAKIKSVSFSEPENMKATLESQKIKSLINRSKIDWVQCGNQDDNQANRKIRNFNSLRLFADNAKSNYQTDRDYHSNVRDLIHKKQEKPNIASEFKNKTNSLLLYKNSYDTSVPSLSGFMKQDSKQRKFIQSFSQVGLTSSVVDPFSANKLSQLRQRSQTACRQSRFSNKVKYPIVSDAKVCQLDSKIQMLKKQIQKEISAALHK